MKTIPLWTRVLLLGSVLLFIVLGAIFWIINSKGPLATVVSVLFVALGLVFSFLQTFPLTKSMRSQETVQAPQPIIIHLPASSPITHKLPGDETHVLSPTHASVQYIGNNEVTSLPVHREDWGEAPSIEHFYGRIEELELLTRWVLIDTCRVIAVLGSGGLGKTTLATQLAEQVKGSFEYIFWRSVQNAPAIEEVLTACLRFFAGPHFHEIPDTFNAQLTLLIEYFRAHRCLVILDNLESVLQKERIVGNYQPGYEAYGQLLQRVGTVHHQSCLLITSREKPREIALLQGNSSSVRALQVAGMSHTEGRAFLQEHMLFGSDTVQNRLIDLYSGNPLALKLTSEPIREVFGGDIARFLQEERAVFGDIQALLAQQFERLSSLERAVLYWLAIEREPVMLEELQARMGRVVHKEALLEVLASLRRRSMIEIQGTTYFTLQPVIIEYVTGEMVQRVYEEIQLETPVLLISHALLRAKAKDYVRNSQALFILVPLGERLLHDKGREAVEQKLRGLLSALHKVPDDSFSYEAGNILNLLISMQYTLSQYDFSHLTVREAYLRDTFFADVSFAYTHFINSVFTDTFSGILSIAFSPDGAIFAAATAYGEIRTWQTSTGKPLSLFQGHSDAVWSVAFSPDGAMLASGSQDTTIRLWDVVTGSCTRVIREHSTRIWSVAFHPDGTLLASGSEDQMVRLWDVRTGTCLQSVHEHTHRVLSVAFNLNGTLLVSGSEDQTIRIWEIHAEKIQRCIQQLTGHHACVRSVVFSSDGVLLASGSEDQTIRLWDVQNGTCLKTLNGHTAFVRSVAFDASGTILASGGDDASVRLWDVRTGMCFNTLRRHRNRIWSVSFSPDSALLASGSDDQTIHLWDMPAEHSLYTLQGHQTWVWSVVYTLDGDVLTTTDQTVRLWNTHTKQLLHTFQGHTNRIRTLACSPDGKQFASGSEDHTICVWEVSTRRIIHTLRGHTDYVRAVVYSPDGTYLASGGDDSKIRVWSATSGTCLYTIQEHTLELRALAFRYDGCILASAGVDQTIRLWDAATGQLRGTLQGHLQRVRALAFQPHTMLLTSGSADCTVRVWDTQTSQCLYVLQGHTQEIRAVAFHPDGTRLASSSDDGTIRLWDLSHQDASPLILQGHEGRIRSIAFSPDGNEIASGSDDGTIKFWHSTTGICRDTIRSDRPYERMNILGATGLTEAQRASLLELGAIEA